MSVVAVSLVAVSLVAFAANLPLGMWRGKYKKFTFSWWLIVHASIPLIVALRIWLDTPYAFIPLFIALAILGQLLGGKILRNRREK